jgi:hypothetical protein
LTAAVRFPAGEEIFLYSTASRPAVGPTQPHIQWVPGALSPGVKQREVTLTTYFHLVPRLRVVELYLHSPIYLHGILLIIKYRNNIIFYTSVWSDINDLGLHCFWIFSWYRKNRLVNSKFY